MSRRPLPTNWMGQVDAMLNDDLALNRAHTECYIAQLKIRLLGLSSTACRRDIKMHVITSTGTCGAMSPRATHSSGLLAHTRQRRDTRRHTFAHTIYLKIALSYGVAHCSKPQTLRFFAHRQTRDFISDARCASRKTPPACALVRLVCILDAICCGGGVWLDGLAQRNAEMLMACGT